jgi:hypothetical protein
MAPLQTSARRENALLLLGCFNPSLVSFDGTSHLHRSSSVASPSGDSSSPRRSEGHRHFRFGRLRSPAFAPPLQSQPTQWKRQFLNFFGCPGSTAPPLPGLSRRVASRRLRKLTTPSARASRSRKPAPRSSSRSLGRSPKSYHLSRRILRLQRGCRPWPLDQQRAHRRGGLHNFLLQAGPAGPIPPPVHVGRHAMTFRARSEGLRGVRRLLLAPEAARNARKPEHKKAAIARGSREGWFGAGAPGGFRTVPG